MINHKCITPPDLGENQVRTCCKSQKEQTDVTRDTLTVNHHFSKVHLSEILELMMTSVEVNSKCQCLLLVVIAVDESKGPCIEFQSEPACLISPFFLSQSVIVHPLCPRYSLCMLIFFYSIEFS